MKKIIILTECFFIKKESNRIGINHIKKFFEVDIIDLTYYFNKKFYLTKQIHFEDKFSDNKIKKIKKIKQFYKYIKNSTNIILAIDHLGLNDKSNRLRDFLSSAGIKILRLYPAEIPEKVFYRNTKRLITKGQFIKIYLKVLSYFQNYLKRKNFKKNVDINLISGLASEKKSSGKKLYCHSWDYEDYLNNLIIKKLIKKPYAVFLDEMMPDAPDYFLLKHIKPISYVPYWKKMNGVLEEIRKKLKLDIIVALHPKNPSKNSNKYLKNFICKKNITINLVRNSKFVLLHTSTAVSFAILYKKPLVYINSEKYGFQTNRIKNFCEITSGTLLNVEEDIGSQINKKSFYKIDKRKYEDYIKKYIKHPLSNNEKMHKLIIKYAQNL